MFCIARRLFFFLAFFVPCVVNLFFYIQYGSFHITSLVVNEELKNRSLIWGRPADFFFKQDIIRQAVCMSALCMYSLEMVCFAVDQKHNFLTSRYDHTPSTALNKSVLCTNDALHIRVWRRVLILFFYFFLKGYGAIFSPCFYSHHSSRWGSEGGGSGVLQ